MTVGERVAPEGALVTVTEDGEVFVARVEVESPLPGLTLAAEAVAAAEPVAAE
ncbi:hypothetical protein NY08_4296 [Rhodococcus sp. B7740]|nr:hypothetical protein NY08_4296 [Rhodococcus sp. B7740]